MSDYVLWLPGGALGQATVSRSLVLYVKVKCLKNAYTALQVV